MVWRVTEGQWDTLAQARQTRPKTVSPNPHGVIGLAVVSGFVGLLVLLLTRGTSVVAQGVTFALFGSAVFACWRRLTHDERSWQRRFNATLDSDGRLLAAIGAERGAPALTYQSIRSKPDWEWLTFELGARIDLELRAGAPVVDDVDTPLLSSAEMNRALLGPVLRLNAPAWHANAGFFITGGVAKVKLGVEGFEDITPLKQIAAALGDYVDRLTAPPEKSLASLARDISHPFDAAYALAALHRQWPDAAEQVCHAIVDTPIGAALARVARTGDGLLDTALDWPTRRAIAHGVLSVRSAAREALVAWLFAYRVTDSAAAMALVDLYAFAQSSQPTLQAKVDAALQIVATQGDAHALTWLRARAANAQRSAAFLVTLDGRLTHAQESPAPSTLTSNAHTPSAALPGIPAAPAAQTPPTGWPIDDAQWRLLDQARTSRPAQLSPALIPVLAGGAMAALFMPFLDAGKLTLPVLLLTVLAAWIVVAYPAHRWRRQFKARKASEGREVVDIPGALGHPDLAYQQLRRTLTWEWLTLEINGPVDAGIEPAFSTIGDAAFDRVLGFSGDPKARALLGSVLRLNAPEWHAAAGFIVADGKAKLKLGADGFNGRATIQRIATAFGGYADRLHENPAAALTALALDFTHPFDSARAFAALWVYCPDAAEAARQASVDDATGQALARVAYAGEGLLESAVDWPTRSAIGRGVLGVPGAASTALASWLETQQPTSGACGMALTDLCETAAALLDLSALQTQAEATLAYVVEHGGPECLTWMQARARHDKASRVGLEAMSARLQDGHGGLLSLDDEAQRGALSEARAGELGIADDMPPD